MCHAMLKYRYSCNLQISRSQIFKIAWYFANFSLWKKKLAVRQDKVWIKLPRPAFHWITKVRRIFQYPTGMIESWNAAFVASLKFYFGLQSLFYNVSALFNTLYYYRYTSGEVVVFISKWYKNIFTVTKWARTCLRPAALTWSSALNDYGTPRS